MPAARFFKTKKVKGSTILGNDPDETWFCVRAKNLSKKEHKEFKGRFQTLCDNFFEEAVKEV